MNPNTLFTPDLYIILYTSIFFEFKYAKRQSLGPNRILIFEVGAILSTSTIVFIFFKSSKFDMVQD